MKLFLFSLISVLFVIALADTKSCVGSRCKRMTNVLANLYNDYDYGFSGGNGGGPYNNQDRYGYSFWDKFVRSSEFSSEEDSSESCIYCSYKNIGNGYGNRNMIYKNSHPDYNDYQGQTEMSGNSFWGKLFRSSELSSEEDSSESGVHCSYTNIGNGYGNRNVIYKNSHPDYNDYQVQTEINQGIERNQNEGPLVPGNGYRMTSKPTYNGFSGNKSQRGDGSYNNQRPFRPNVNQINEIRRPYNDYETNYNRKRDSDCPDCYARGFVDGDYNHNIIHIEKK